jgi:hypothetical protein
VRRGVRATPFIAVAVFSVLVIVKRQLVARQQMIDELQRSRLGTEHARRHLALVAQGTQALMGSREDESSALRSLVGVMVPEFADWCAVDAVEDGEIRRLAAAHARSRRRRAGPSGSWWWRTSYTLAATSGSLTGATSSPFNIAAGSASKLAFTTSPSNSTGGVAFGTQPVVLIQDAFGNTVISDSTSSVTLAVTSGTGTSGAALTCTPATAINGVASFAGCKIDKAGTGYTLTATSGSLTSATSNPFNITVGPASKLAFNTSPSNSTGGVAFGTQPVVTVQDAGGNTVISDSTSSVTLAITSGTGTSGAALSCAPATAVNGVASFSGCKIDKAGMGYTLTATSGSLASATSSPFNITVGSASKLAFTTSPSNSAVGQVFPTQPVVAVQDAGGNPHGHWRSPSGNEQLVQHQRSPGDHLTEYK